MVAGADVGDDRDLAAIEGEPLPGQPAAGVSNTAASTSRCISTLRALRGPLQSPVSILLPWI